MKRSKTNRDPNSAGGGAIPDSAAIAQAVDELQEEEGWTEKKRTPARRAIGIILDVILVLAILIAAFCTYVSFVSTSGNGVPNLLGTEFFSIQTDSMYPTLKSGDLIIDRTIKDTSTLRTGDIITYWTVIDGERVLNTHRIYQIYDGGGYLIFETKGDNNASSDALTVHESEVVGKYATRIGGIGKVFDFLQTSTGFLIVIVIPVFLFFLYHLVQFFRVLFEYQNVKNRLKYEQERGNAEDAIEARKRAIQEQQEKQRAAIEESIRNQIMQEMLAEQRSSREPASDAAPEPPVSEASAPAESPADKPEPAPEPAEQTAAEEAPVVVPAAAPAEPNPAAEEVPAQPESQAPVASAEEQSQIAEGTPVEETETASAEPAAPAQTAAAAVTEEQRAAIEAELRQKILLELLAQTQQTASSEHPIGTDTSQALSGEAAEGKTENQNTGN